MNYLLNQYVKIISLNNFFLLYNPFNQVVTILNKTEFKNLKKGFTLDNTLDFVNKLNGVTSWSFNILLNKSIKFNKNFVKQLFDASKILLEKGITEDRFFSRRIARFAKHEFYVKECAGMGNQIVVTPKGDFGICHCFDWNHNLFFPYNLQNFDLNKDLTKLEPWISWNLRTPFNIPQCQNCIAITLCGGGCIAKSNKGKYLNIYNLDKSHCKIYKQFTYEFLSSVGEKLVKDFESK